MATGQAAAEFDVVVVGGSFAGLVFAREAALRGLRVAVMDHRSHPGARLRTTGILVKEAADTLHVPRTLTRKIRGVRLYGPRRACVDLSEPGYYFLATDTAGVLEWLAQRAAQAGARLLWAQRFHGAARSDHGRCMAITGTALRTRFLVGADGAHSRVARSVGLARNRHHLVGVEAEFPPHPDLDDDRLHCFLDRELAPGYLAWMVPGVGMTQVGLARTFPGRPDLPRLLRRLADVADFRDARPLGWRAGTIPVGGPLARIHAPDVLLIGDAAGWVSPLTGGGIANAFQYSRRAAQRVSDHLLDDGPAPGPALLREIPRYRAKRLLRGAYVSLGGDRICASALESPLVRRVARQIFFHPRLGQRVMREARPVRTGELQPD
jgi:flavin-dependent dehydrogenase